jgi:hypothetical protein
VDCFCLTFFTLGPAWQKSSLFDIFRFIYSCMISFCFFGSSVRDRVDLLGEMTSVSQSPTSNLFKCKTITITFIMWETGEVTGKAFFKLGHWTSQHSWRKGFCSCQRPKADLSRGLRAARLPLCCAPSRTWNDDAGMQSSQSSHLTSSRSKGLGAKRVDKAVLKRETVIQEWVEAVMILDLPGNRSGAFGRAHHFLLQFSVIDEHSLKLLITLVLRCNNQPPLWRVMWSDLNADQSLPFEK